MADRPAPTSRLRFTKTRIAGAVFALASLAIGMHLVNIFSGKDYDPGRTESWLDSIPDHGSQAVPNLIIILTDDMGLGDLGHFGSQAIATPHLDRMAKEGATLTNFYSSAPVCSPSRAGLLTGRYPVRTLVFDVVQSPGLLDWAFRYIYGAVPHGIPADEALLPEMLKQRGYRTGLVGKWHLGWESPHLPNENGFDFFYGGLLSHDNHPYHVYRNDRIEIPEPVDFDELTKNLTREAVDFITQNRDHPFFLYYAQHFPHVPLHASEDFAGKSGGGRYGDSVEELDWSVGRILETLEELELDDRTLVMFTSDNGPWWQGDAGGLRGRKNLPFEGGYHVPFIARWPGVIPAGLVSDFPAMNFDLTATGLAAAGVPSPSDRIFDGVDLLPLLRGEPNQPPHDVLFFYKGRNLVGVRSGHWKYLRRHSTDNGAYPFFPQGPLLFDLETDPHESYDLRSSHPEVARRLSALLDQQDFQNESNLRGWMTKE